MKTKGESMDNKGNQGTPAQTQEIQRMGNERRLNPIFCQKLLGNFPVETLESFSVEEK